MVQSFTPTSYTAIATVASYSLTIKAHHNITLTV